MCDFHDFVKKICRFAEIWVTPIVAEDSLILDEVYGYF